MDVEYCALMMVTKKDIGKKNGVTIVITSDHVVQQQFVAHLWEGLGKIWKFWLETCKNTVGRVIKDVWGILEGGVQNTKMLIEVRKVMSSLRRFQLRTRAHRIGSWTRKQVCCTLAKFVSIFPFFGDFREQQTKYSRLIC